MSGRPARVLIVEDEPDLASGVRDNLRADGYEAEVAADGETGLARALQDLVLLDVMLPDLDGFELCRRLRAAGNEVAVLFLTARDDPEDRIRGLEEGGDDYLTKPFRLQELLLRVRAILRRSRWYRERAAARVRFGANEVDLLRYTARGHDGRRHRLTHKEAMILKLLHERAGEVVTRDEILDTVWGYGAFPTSRTVDNFILRLRRRFEPDPARPVFLRTVHGAGYRFTPEGGRADEG